MTKKLTLSLTPSEPAYELLDTVDLIDEYDLPAGWSGAIDALRALVKRVRGQADEVFSLARALQRKRGVQLRAEAPGRTAGTPLRVYRLEVDLPELFSGGDAKALAGQLFELLRRVQTSGLFVADGRLGRTRTDDLGEVVDALVKSASRAGIFLDPHRQPDVRFDADDEESEHASAPRKSKKASAPPPRNEARKSAADEAPRAGKNAATEGKAPAGKVEGKAEGKPRGKAPADKAEGKPRDKAPADKAEGRQRDKAPAGKGKGKGHTQGSFGGLPDDALPGGHGAKKSHGAHPSDEAQFFLSYAQLAWPSTLPEVRAAYKRVVKAAHPDKNPGDPGANHRFMLLKRGYDELLKRLEG